MKKAFLLFVATAALTLTSCSGDDSPSTPKELEDLTPVGTVTMKVNGVEKTFNTIVMNVQVSESSGEKYLYFTASQNGSATEMISFGTAEGVVGAGQMTGIECFTGGVQAYTDFATNVLVNNNEVYKASFSGSYTTWDQSLQNPTTTTVTEGNVNISLE